MKTKKKRLVAIIFFKNGNIVQSKQFKQHKVVGDPYTIIDRLSSWNADEVIYLNIRPQLEITSRQDKSIKYNNDFENIIKYVGKKAFMPLTVGGGIKNLKDVEKYFYMGADKISINSEIEYNPNLILNCTKIYGSQSIVASVDVKLDASKKYSAFVSGGKKAVSSNLEDYIRKIEDLGVGELLINNIDRDGTAIGYDLKLIDLIKNFTKLPLIFTGGAGKFEDFAKGFNHGLDTVAAGNMFHFSENSYYEAIKYLSANKYNVRPPTLMNYFK